MGKIKQESRAEKLKSKLGISDSKIKAKEQALAKELNRINSKNN